METLAVAVVLFIACFSVVRHFFRAAKRKNGGCAGGCSACRDFSCPFANGALETLKKRKS